MSMIIPAESAYGKEMWRFEHYDDETRGSGSAADPIVRGLKPRQYKPYPARMYRMTQKNPWKWEAETASDENAQRNLESRGFVAGGLGAAALAFDASMQNLALAAAHRNYEDRNMSEQAKAESNEAEQASSKHLGEIPRTPIKKRGRPAKQTVSA